MLTRGNTLKPKVLLLGGPNTYLPFLQACWRQRIPETWEARGFEYPKDVPSNSYLRAAKRQYYAAYGAVSTACMSRPTSGVTGTRSAQGVRRRRTHGAQLGAHGRPGRSSRPAELDAFRREYPIPTFVAATFEPGSSVRAVIGLDGGSTSSKAVLMDEDGQLLTKQYHSRRATRSKDTKEMLARIKLRARSGRDARGASASARPAMPRMSSRSRSAPT